MGSARPSPKSSTPPVGWLVATLHVGEHHDEVTVLDGVVVILLLPVHLDLQVLERVVLTQSANSQPLLRGFLGWGLAHDCVGEVDDVALGDLLGFGSTCHSNGSLQ